MSQLDFVLSANAIPGVGGQGLNLLHMMQCFAPDYSLETYCSGSSRNAFLVQVVPPSAWALRIAKVPILRRRRDWIVLLSERNYDRQVAARLKPSHYFQGASGQCLESLSVAKKRGTCSILDVLTLHNDVYSAAIRGEARHFGITTFQHPSLEKAILEEYRQADYLRVMSTPARATFLERGFDERRVFVAPPPADLIQIPEQRLEPDPFTISYVGLLEPAKGFHFLIDAFQSLHSREAQLWLWGNSGNRQVARYLGAQMARNPRIQLKPFSVRELGHEKVYGASSVLVHPSLADGFGYVVAEAMAAGIPVITTTATGASEWVRDGVNGFVVAPRDSHALRERLEWLMANPAQRLAMGRQARIDISRLTLEGMRAAYRLHLPIL